MSAIWIEHRCGGIEMWEPGATELGLQLPLGARSGQLVLCWQRSAFWPADMVQSQVMFIPHCPWCGKRMEWEIPYSSPWVSRAERGHAKGTSPLSEKEIEDIWVQRKAEAELRRRRVGVEGVRHQFDAEALP